MSLSPQWLDELRARITLSGVIGRTTRLTRAGREFKACCPFHDEKSPSFTVNDEKGFYHCFGCGAHGDAIRWLTDQRGLSFMDAVKELAAEAGMEVPAPDPRAAREAERRDSLHDVMAAAQAWFVERLASPEGEHARAYLATRGFDAHTIGRFGFGYAPEGRQALKAALSRFPEAMLVEAGLRIAVEDPDSSTRKEPYDRFRDRLMLPIEDARGRVIAFGGRILEPGRTDAPKYLNSPDTPLFDKGRTLYNLHRAGPASRRSNRIVVVEGYMDVIALAAAGIEDAVAPMGTALTERQIEMLWRLAPTPVLCFDGDAAGQRAAMRAIARALPLLRPAHSLRIVRLPAGMDPDDLLKREGTAAMERLLGEAKSLIETLWEHERDAAPLHTPEDKAGLKARLLAHVGTIAHPDIASLYRRDLMERYSARAYPPRDPAAPWRGPERKVPAAAGTPRNLTRLRASSQGGARAALAEAVLDGLVRWPAEIGRHSEALARAPLRDSRFDLLIDLAESGQPLETQALVAIFSRQALPLPKVDGTRRSYPFVRDDADPQLARDALAAAIALLTEEPAIDAALDEATGRFDLAEQDRLRRRKRDLGDRLRALAGQARTAGNC